MIQFRRVLVASPRNCAIQNQNPGKQEEEAWQRLEERKERRLQENLKLEKEIRREEEKAWHEWLVRAFPDRLITPSMWVCNKGEFEVLAVEDNNGVEYAVGKDQPIRYTGRRCTRVAPFDDPMLKYL